jgi:uncharacterized protein YtpQ (UPF0354 family)
MHCAFDRQEPVAQPAMQASSATWTNTESLTRRSVIAGSATVVLCNPHRRAFAGDPMEDGSFRDEVVRLIKQRRPQLQIELPQDPGSLIIGKKHVYLENLYRTIANATGRAREEAILNFVDMGLAAGGSDPAERDFAVARPRLRARIIHRDYQNLENASNRIVVRPLSEETRLAYVIDSDASAQFVMEAHIQAWSTTADVVHISAIENLDTISRHVEINASSGDQTPGGYATHSVSDSFAAARIVSSVFMKRLHEILGAQIFVAVPNRDFLVAWTPDWEKRREFSEQVTKDILNRPYPLSDELFVSAADGLRLATKQELADHGRT